MCTWGRRVPGTPKSGDTHHWGGVLTVGCDIRREIKLAKLLPAVSIDSILAVRNYARETCGTHCRCGASLRVGPCGNPAVGLLPRVFHNGLRGPLREGDRHRQHAGLRHVRRAAVIRTALLTTERPCWYCGAHTVEPKSARYRFRGFLIMTKICFFFFGTWVAGDAECWDLVLLG